MTGRRLTTAEWRRVLGYTAVALVGALALLLALRWGDPAYPRAPRAPGARCVQECPLEIRQGG